MSTIPLTIVPADATHLDAIASLEKRSFPAPWKREFFSSEVGAIGRYNRVACGEDHGIVGYIFAMYLFDEMHINKIAVEEAVRRQGVATLLMADCFEYAASHEVTAISLEVRESNSGAQDFYRRLAFKPVYRRRNYYPDGEAAIVMSKVLDQ